MMDLELDVQKYIIQQMEAIQPLHQVMWMLREADNMNLLLNEIMSLIIEERILHEI
jgi:hypothetical protein